jgi:hypothetical protein
MHLVSHRFESIRRTGSGDIFTTDISEQLHISNVKAAYRSTNNVKYIQQILKHNDQSAGLDYMEGTLSFLPLQSCYDIDLANVFNLLSTANKRRNSCWAHVLRLQHCQDEPFFRPLSPQVHYLRETHVCGVLQKYQINLTLRCIRGFRKS